MDILPSLPVAEREVQIGQFAPRGTTRDESGNIVESAYETPSLANIGGGATDFSVSGTSYPIDVTSNPEYGGNYVMFYISVHKETLLTKNYDGPTIPGGLPNRMTGDATQANYGSAALGAAALGEGAIWGKGSGLGSGAVEGLSGSEMTKDGKSVLDVSVGAAFAASAIDAIGDLKDEMRTMKEGIALYMPGDLAVKYNVSWESESMAMAAAVAETLSYGKMNDGSPAQQKQQDQGPNAARSYLAGKALSGKTGALIGKTSATAANPKKEQLFKEVDFRTFSFTYQFFPKDPTEAAAVERIIKLFKYHMHPNYKDANHFLYVYPSEFDIRYYTNGRENLHLHRHPSCVLTDMNVTYAPNGTFNSFANGMPTQINVSLTFKELALMSKETIADGY